MNEFLNYRVSIIIPWLREKWLHLEGTLEALLHFTPDELIEEIIFISDGNKDPLENELKSMSPKVKVVAFKKRQGLIRAKMHGAEMAKAPVLVFFEAHCIANRDWLQPLLTRIKLNRKVIAHPQLDIIPQTDWTAYHIGVNGHWRYEWNFNLIMTNPGHIEPRGADIYTSPGASGGIFAIDKKWFKQLRLYDVGMLEWGGDHMELTMKVWRCGGKIELIPCSRVGHLFRDPEHRPYNVNVNQVILNYKRLAELWAKDHLDYFYAMKPEAVHMNSGDMTKIKKDFAKLEAELQCKNLSWYLDNVDHEMKWEMSRICHPYVDDNNPFKCKGKLVPGRWTVTQAMPLAEYKRARAMAEGVNECSSEDECHPEL